MLFAVGYLWRRSKNPFWYETSSKNKVTMILIAEAVVSLSWIVILFGSYNLQNGNSQFIVFGLIWLLLYMIVFLILPLVFIKAGLTNQKVEEEIIDDKK